MAEAFRGGSYYNITFLASVTFDDPFLSLLQGNGGDYSIWRRFLWMLSSTTCGTFMCGLIPHCLQHFPRGTSSGMRALLEELLNRFLRTTSITRYGGSLSLAWYNHRTSSLLVSSFKSSPKRFRCATNKVDEL
ncbi:hypothetical protein V6N12_021070 [Hibiscus sabdariffa]|uniref:Uncharacterized protein n=1 Tax=Hibiscus sabdariffa TaxID=183260 RepID=A0ABR2B424_9ROSI